MYWNDALQVAADQPALPELGMGGQNLCAGSLILQNSPFFFKSLIEAFEHFDGLPQILIGRFEAGVLFHQFPFFFLQRPVAVPGRPSADLSLFQLLPQFCGFLSLPFKFPGEQHNFPERCDPVVGIFSGDVFFQSKIGLHVLMGLDIVAAIVVVVPIKLGKPQVRPLRPPGIRVLIYHLFESGGFSSVNIRRLRSGPGRGARRNVEQVRAPERRKEHGSCKNRYHLFQ
ncbi:MAG: hypothetical protein PVI76_12510 [Desulfobacterales bacterium]|jgi:hypothetical protein